MKMANETELGLGPLVITIETALRLVRVQPGPEAVAALQRGEPILLTLGDYRELAFAAARALMPRRALTGSLEELLARARLVDPEPLPLAGNCDHCDAAPLTGKEPDARFGKVLTVDQCPQFAALFPKTQSGTLALNRLLQHGVSSAKQLRGISDEELATIPNIGSGRIKLIRSLLEGK